MPDIEPLRFPSREERRPAQPDQVDLQGACSGRRRTCALLNSPSPCVTSAIQHIQELRAKVDKCFQQPGKYHSQIDLDKSPYDQNLRFQPGDSDASVMSTELVIEGIGLTPREGSSSSPLLKKINDVLREIVYLIERLEADRQYAEEALLVEKRRKMFLEKKYDSISLWMQKEHSVVVQKEHEACLRDITELKWQLRLEQDKLDKLKETLALSEMKKQRFHEDINFSKDQIPIVKDNMNFQRSLINQINADQKEILNISTQGKEEMEKNDKLQAMINSLMEDIEKTRVNGEAEVSCTKAALLSARNTYDALHAENLERKEKVEDYKVKISESKKAVKQMHEERKQMLQKIIDNDEQWERAKEEVTLVVSQHCTTQAKLEEQEQLTFMEEEKARKVIESLRTDLNSQITAVETLKVQCAKIKGEIYHYQQGAEQTNLKLQRELEESTSAMKIVKYNTENLKALITQMENLEKEHIRTLDNLNKENLTKQEQLQAAKDLNAATKKRYDCSVDRICELTKQSQDFYQASAKLEEVLETMPAAIEELESVFAVVEFKNKSSALIMNTLQSDINNGLQRTQRSMQVHTAHVTARKKKMEDTQEELRVSLSENKQLARTYEKLTEVLLENKRDAAFALTEKNNAQRSFLDYKELSLLQKRMHKALVKYFKQRSLYSQAQLDQCQALSQESDQKIKTAQEWLAEEIHAISTFLQSLADSTSLEEVRVNKQANSDATQ
uniref:Coiled-coil domain-containing protein 178 n=1 Tax=Knipowitschia caucasica TaxID=637954 RepID=A0AAV2JS94_KNICA